MSRFLEGDADHKVEMTMQFQPGVRASLQVQNLILESWRIGDAESDFWRPGCQ